MACRDDDRLKPPERWGPAVEAGADAVSGAVRLGLTAAALPALALPSSVRGSVSEAVHTAVEAVAILPHAVSRGVIRFADDLAGRG